MSMREWSESGFGFPILNGRNASKVEGFILGFSKRCTDLTDEESEILATADDDELEAVVEDVLNDRLDVVVAETINEMEGMELVSGYAPSEEECGHVGIPMMYPWSDLTMEILRRKVSDPEKYLKDKLKVYTEMLGIEEEPDYFELFYYG